MLPFSKALKHAFLFNIALTHELESHEVNGTKVLF